MPYNGSGTYVAPTNSFAQAVSDTTISSTDWNAVRADLETALSTCLLKDGQTTVTANLPMATYRHTGVSNATALTDYASADQVVDNALTYGGASSAGTDAYSVTLPISPVAYVVGQTYSFLTDVGNTGACSVNFNSIGVGNIKLIDGNDPYTGAIQATAPVHVQYTGTNFILLNPYVNGLYDSNGLPLLATVTTASAVNYPEVTNSATANDPSIKAAGTDANINLELDGKGTGRATTKNTPVYGMVWLDQAENLVATGSTTVGSWTTINSTTLGTAGATKAILKFIDSSLYASTTFSSTVFLRPTGTAYTNDDKTKVYWEKGDGSVASNQLNTTEFAPVNLDSSGDFDYYHALTTGATNNLAIWLAGYYV